MNKSYLSISSIFVEKGVNLKISHKVYHLVKREFETVLDHHDQQDGRFENIGIQFSTSKKISKPIIKYDEDCSFDNCYFVKFPFVEIDGDLQSTIFYTEKIIAVLSLLVCLVSPDIYIVVDLLEVKHKIIKEIQDHFEDYKYIDPMRFLHG